MTSPRPSVLCFTGIALALAWGCCPRRPPETPFGQTEHGAALIAQGIDPSRARQIIAQASPRHLREMRQLMFIADLRMASGSESNPLRLYRRVEHELAEPVVISHNDAEVILDEIARVVRTLPRDGSGAVILSREEGWEVVRRVLSSAEGLLPSTGDCLQRIMTYPEDLAVAFLYQEFISDHHYHDHNMRVAILRALETGGAGARALPIYAQALRDERDSTYSSIFRSAAAGARQVLGPHFDAWYWEVQNRAYCRDER